MPDTVALRKARGAYFTPSELTRFVADWAIRGAQDVVLEPSCGEAAFLVAAGRRLSELGTGSAEYSTQLKGVEIHALSAASARDLLASKGFSAEIVTSDFFDLPATPRYDAVIGNPPYVRYQQFSGDNRAKALEAALAHGVRLTGLASSWAAFTVHAAQFVKPEGRLGLVLPAELLTVNYAAQVRRFLLQRFGKVQLVLFEDRVFPGVLEEVVLLLAQGTGGAPSFEVYQARNLDDLAALDTARWTGFTPRADGKWTPALLPASAFDSYQELFGGPGFESLIKWGETYLGAVTGNNSYFTLSHAQATKLRLSADDILPISPPGSRHLRGLAFSKGAWEELRATGARCWLFAPGDEPSLGAQRYIDTGEFDEVDGAYKCRMRDPWWRVPLVEKPDLLLTYMNHDRPRLTTNAASVDLLNSVYGVRLRSDRRRIGRNLLPIASLNSVTLLGAEVVGRSYGGGMLKLEPKEADQLPVPSLATVRKAAHELEMLRPQLADALRQNDLTRAVALVDGVLLSEQLGLSAAQITILREAREFLFQRRVSRSKPDRGEN